MAEAAVRTGALPAEAVRSDAHQAPGTSGASSRVLYLGHLPHGFFEDEMRKFFSQFGVVTNVRVSRNKATGKSKHYGFVEFQSPEVAAIAAEAMDGYFMFKQKLVCQLMAPDSVHEELFKGANKKFRPPPRQKLERQRLHRPRTQEELDKLQQRAMQKDQQRRAKLAAAGIVYDWPALGQNSAASAAAQAAVKQTPTSSAAVSAEAIKDTSDAPLQQQPSSRAARKAAKPAVKAGQVQAAVQQASPAAVPASVSASEPIIKPHKSKRSKAPAASLQQQPHALATDKAAKADSDPTLQPQAAAPQQASAAARKRKTAPEAADAPSGPALQAKSSPRAGKRAKAPKAVERMPAAAAVPEVHKQKAAKSKPVKAAKGAVGASKQPAVSGRKQ